jgi:hypothetical protein
MILNQSLNRPSCAAGWNSRMRRYRKSRSTIELARSLTKTIDRRQSAGLQTKLVSLQLYSVFLSVGRRRLRYLKQTFAGRALSANSKQDLIYSAPTPRDEINILWFAQVTNRTPCDDQLFQARRDLPRDQPTEPEWPNSGWLEPEAARCLSQ